MSHPPAGTIVIYRDRLLGGSETFIRAQAESMRRFVPLYVGSTRVDGLDLPADRVLTLSQGGVRGKAREYLFKRWGLAPDLVRRLRKFGPRLIHAHFGIDGALALPLRRELGVPMLVTYHGYDATVTDEHAARSFYSHRLYLKRRGVLQAETTVFVAVSRFVRERLIHQSFPEEKVIVHYTGVDTDLFRPPDGCRRGSVVLFVGRLVPQKGCGYLIRAMRSVQERVPEAELVIIGEGELGPALKRESEHAGVRSRFLGHQSADTVRSWMGRAGVFCVPSVTAPTGASEGFGMVFLEAQSMGIPVVSFATGGVPEAVAHERTGLLAPEKNWEVLGEYITILLQDTSLWRQFSVAARARVCQEFDLARQTRLLESCYESVLDGRLLSAV